MTKESFPKYLVPQLKYETRGKAMQIYKPVGITAPF